MKIAPLALVALMLMASLTEVAFAQVAVVYEGWGTAGQPIKARPGYTDYPFTVQVAGTSALYGQLNLTGLPFTNSTFGRLARASPISVSPLTLTFYLNVNRDAQPGVYSIPLTLFLSNGSKVKLLAEAVVSQAPAIFVLQTSWSEPAYPGAGQDALALLLSNPTGDSLSHVVVRVSLTDGIYNSTGGSVAYVYVESVPPHSFYQASVQLNVSNRARPGTYYMNYTASFFDQEGVEYASSGKAQAYVASYPGVSVSISGLSLSPGSEGIVSVTVRNTGQSPVYDIALSFSAAGLEVVGGNESTLSYLGAGQSANRTFIVYASQAAQPGVYPVTVVASYLWAGGQSSIAEIGQVSVASQAPVQVSVTPSALIYERNNSVLINVTNELGYPLQGVKVSVASQGLAYIYPSTGQFSLGTLQPGSSGSAVLYVLPYGQSGSLPIQLTVTYQNQFGASESYVDSLQLFVRGLPQVSITQVSMPAATNGTSETISGVLLNSGTASAYYGTIYMEIPALGVNESEYIGDLPTDSPTPFSFTFQVPSGASGSYPVQLVYSYLDQYGNSYTAHASATLLVLQGHVVRQGHAIGLGLIYLVVALAVGVVAGFAAGRLRRK